MLEIDLESVLERGSRKAPILAPTGPLRAAAHVDHPALEIGPHGLACPATSQSQALGPVALQRRPFHRSTGRWHCACPGCGRWVRVLALGPISPARRPDEITASPSPPAVQPWWACRRCHRLGSAASRESPDQRLLRAARKAEAAIAVDTGLIPRRRGETLKAFRLRHGRARAVLMRLDTMIESERETAHALTRVRKLLGSHPSG